MKPALQWAAVLGAGYLAYRYRIWRAHPKLGGAAAAVALAYVLNRAFPNAPPADDDGVELEIGEPTRVS